MIVALRTDAMVIELYGLLDGAVTKELRQEVGREMARQLPGIIEEFLQDQAVDGLIVFRGPGSFTGLRIGATVMNVLAYTREVSIVGTLGDDWVMEGVKRLAAGENDGVVLPEYGAPANVTAPRK